MSDSADVVPFDLHIDAEQLQDLRTRLAATRWPDPAPADPQWRHGVPLALVQRLVDHWRDAYDWRRCEATLNGLGQHRTTLDGVGVHFLHVRSPEAAALPVLLTHGWPGSVLEYVKAIPALVDPAAHGGDPADAFDVVVPSLPGFGFSDHPDEPGWNVDRIAQIWPKLMRRLGYDRWVAQGGDWGAYVTVAMAEAQPDGLAGVHVSTANLTEPEGAPPLPAEQAHRMQQVRSRFPSEWGYLEQQSTRPQTLGYALSDSPAGQLAWIFEKLWAWTDHHDDLSEVLSDDDVLDDVMLYWLTSAATSSARLYWESFPGATMSRPVHLPIGVSAPPRDTDYPPRAWAEQWWPGLHYWNEPERGGHFLAWEQPDLLVQDLRSSFRPLRQTRTR